MSVVRSDPPVMDISVLVLPDMWYENCEAEKDAWDNLY